MPPPQVPPRKRWTREQCASLEAAGLFETERVELIDGELISKMGKNRPHIIATMAMMVWLLRTFGDEFVDSEAPIDVNPGDKPLNEPEPDIIVLTRNRATFPLNPEPGDIRMVIEISDSSITFDLTKKAALYARAGIQEYWILDINNRRLFTHRNPAPPGYSSIVIYNESETLAPLAAPEAQLQISTVLPPLL